MTAMSDLSALLNNHTPEDVLGALYYAARYIKQADHLSRYEKDIFDDDERSTPTDKVKQLTWEIVKWVEAQEGMVSGKFDTQTLIRVFALLEDIGSRFETNLSEEELRDAEAAMASLIIPQTQ